MYQTVVVVICGGQPKPRISTFNWFNK